MKFFLKNITMYLMLTFLLLSIIGISTYKFKRQNNNIARKEFLFNKKLLFFKKFIKNKDSINLVMGSSLMKESVIPDSLSGNWFSLSNPGQSILNSLKLLQFIQKEINVDTLIIAINPFDFKHISSNEGVEAYLTRFDIFGYNFLSFKKTIDRFRNYFLPHLIEYSSTTIKRPKEVQDVWTDQGYSGRIYAPIIDLDSLYDNTNIINRNGYKYYYGLADSIYMINFENFYKLTNSTINEVIYIFTPKSEHYLFDVKTLNNNKIKRSILNKMKKKNIIIWDYDELNTKKFKINFFRDETHLSNEGAKVFTQIIKNRLKEI